MTDTRTRIVYHSDGTKTVHEGGKTYGTDWDARTFDSDADYHSHLINTYYDLECRGELKMSASEKRRTRDLHVLAQDPGYWR